MSELTQAELKTLLSYEPETGVFRWIKTLSNRAPAGSVAGCKSHGYTVIRVNDVLQRAHRLAWLYVYGEWPKRVLDHINGDRSDNRIENLRDVTRGQNLQNRTTAGRNSKTGILGVHPWRGKWMARIHLDGKSIHLGTFDSPDDAQVAYLRAKHEIHPYMVAR